MIDRREKLEALLFFGLNSLSIPLWWLSLLIWPSTRAIYFGTEYSKIWRWDFALPDNLSAVVGLVACYAILKAHPSRTFLAWIYTGMLAYAWGLSAAIALTDPTAYLGCVIMSVTLALSVAFAVRFQGIDILWGPFQFCKADPACSVPLKQRSFRQICAMWGTFLVIIPLAIAAVETFLGWNTQWIHFPFQTFLAVVLFAIGGATGLSANAAMNRFGDGTPLPSDCPHKLVLVGPYRYLRNPMAFGGILQGVAVAVLIGSPLILVYALAGGIMWEILVRPLEEVYLESEFGDDYLAYAKSVRCWIPGFGR